MDYQKFINQNVQNFLNQAVRIYHHLELTKPYLKEKEKINYSLLISGVYYQEDLRVNPFTFKDNEEIIEFFDLPAELDLNPKYDKDKILLKLVNFLINIQVLDLKKAHPNDLTIDLILYKVLNQEDTMNLLNALKISYVSILDKAYESLQKSQMVEEEKIVYPDYIKSLNAAMQEYLYITLSYYKILENSEFAEKEKIALFLAGVNCTSVFSQEEATRIFTYFKTSNLVKAVSPSYLQDNLGKFEALINDISINIEDNFSQEFMAQNGIYVAFYKLIENPDNMWLDHHLNTIFDSLFSLQLINRLEKIINLKLTEFSNEQKSVKKSYDSEKPLKPINLKSSNNASKNKNKGKALVEFGTWLTDKTYAFDPAVGREAELKELKLDLLKSKSVILIGEAGVGKTALVKGLANDIKNANVPNLLKNREIVQIDLQSLISGTKYRGDFEKRVKQIIDEAKNNPNLILYFEEIHTVKGLGDSADSSFDLMNMLKPYLSSGEIKIIGDTTIREYDKFIARDAAFSRRFIVETIAEPNSEVLKKIVLAKITELTNHYRINFNFGVYNENIIFESLIALTDSKKQAFYSTRKNPDFVLDVLENIFAVAAYNNHEEVTYDDIFTGMNMVKDVSDVYKNRIIYELQKTLNLVKKENQSRILKFPNAYSLK